MIDYYRARANACVWMIILRQILGATVKGKRVLAKRNLMQLTWISMTVGEIWVAQKNKATRWKDQEEGSKNFVKKRKNGWNAMKEAKKSGKK